MNNEARELKIKALVNSLDIPPSAYEKAYKRYHALGDWFEREESLCAEYSPKIHPQGSFRLGTVIRPLDENGAFDLDVGCRLREGLSKYTNTQYQVKHLVGDELEDYRIANQFTNEKEEKHRCWCLEYAGELNFHMDVVPSIPEESFQAAILAKEMVKHGSADQSLADNVVQHAGAITDNTHERYKEIAYDWHISNSEGYAIWFESQIKLSKERTSDIELMAKKAEVEDLPAWKWKSPLQEAVQVLKRNRDVMFNDNDDAKPISIILTTLAARAYQGEATTAAALERILNDMDHYVNPVEPRVPNPVNPIEDFADKWPKPQYAHLQLEDNFKDWLAQARRDLSVLLTLTGREELQKHASLQFRSIIKQDDLDQIMKFEDPAPPQAPLIITEPKSKPWCK